MPLYALFVFAISTSVLLYVFLSAADFKTNNAHKYDSDSINSLNKALSENPKAIWSLRNYGISNNSINDDGTISLLFYFKDDVAEDEIMKLCDYYDCLIEEEPTGSGYVITSDIESMLDILGRDEIRVIEEAGPPPTTY